MATPGPSPASRWKKSDTATRTATMGTIQIFEMRSLRAATTSGRGASRGSTSATGGLRVVRIPHQPRIEGDRGEHREHRGGGEERNAGTWPHRHDGRELHQRHHERIDEYVEHRPAADELHDVEESRGLAKVDLRAKPRHEAQRREDADLADGNHHAGHEHDERQ